MTWNEFLTFLDNEGTKREIVNDARIYGFGIKRFEEGSRIRIKTNGGMSDYFIDNLLLMECDNVTLCLSIFENNLAKVYNIKNFKEIMMINFPSKYAVPKDKDDKHNKQRLALTHKAIEQASGSAPRKELNETPENKMNTIGSETGTEFSKFRKRSKRHDLEIHGSTGK